METNEYQFKVGRANDYNINYLASSGGIGTSIINYLLSVNEYGTAINFNFNRDKCCYVPELIYDANDINICGSIYHNIDLYDFVERNLHNIINGLIITCLPCEVAPLRKLLNNNGVKTFIISLACSGQMNLKGTYLYYKTLSIKRKNILNMQYRGNGWPSGIKIELINGDKVFKPNYSEPWVTIHKSKLFSLKKCFYCKYNIPNKADIVLADPWLKSYIEKDTIGHTLFVINSKEAENIIFNMEKQNLISVNDASFNDWHLAQENLINKKNYVHNNKSVIDLIYMICVKWSFYNFIFSSNFMLVKIHCLILRFVVKMKRILSYK